jgi:hypothetical protein
MLMVGNVDGPTNYPFSVEETMRLLRLMCNRWEQDLADRELAITWILDSINGKMFDVMIMVSVRFWPH